MDDINEALKELWLKEDLGNNTLFIGNLLLDKMWPKKQDLKENYKGFNPSEIVMMFKDVGGINLELHDGENNSPPHYNSQLMQIGVQQIDNIESLE